MYVRKTKRRYKGKSYVHYSLVESVRTAKGPRQKTICNLGALSPRPASEWLKFARKIEAALLGQADLFAADGDAEIDKLVQTIKAGRQAEPAEPDSVAVFADRVSTEQHREAGAVHVGLEFWRRLGMDRILTDVGLDLAARRLTCAMTLNRLIAPSSEHAMPGWFRRTALNDLLDIDLEAISEDPLYANMDKLYPHRASIESALVERERSLFNLDPGIYLYDLTSTYFEGQALANPKAKRGYSRDHRPDCKQVVVGLAIGREGFPIAHEIYAGNTQDRSTLGHMLDRLDERVGLPPGATVVLDRGMAYAHNLEELKHRKLHYIVAALPAERDLCLAEFGDADGFVAVERTPSPRNPAQSTTRIRVKQQRHGDETLVLCHSSGRVEKDRAIRERKEQRLLADLDRLAQRIDKGRLVRPVKIGEAIGRLKERYPRVARYYDIDYDPESKCLTRERRQDDYAEAQQLDGCYLLKTDRDDLSADETWRVYSLLTRAENAFRNMKSPLAERPIFHHLERRVDTHIFLCVLAFHLLVAIEKTLIDQGLHTSWATVRDTLSTHQICTVVLPTSSGETLRIRKSATPEPEHKKLYKLLKMNSRIITQQKTWRTPV